MISVLSLSTLEWIPLGLTDLCESIQSSKSCTSLEIARSSLLPQPRSLEFWWSHGPLSVLKVEMKKALSASLFVKWQLLSRNRLMLSLVLLYLLTYLKSPFSCPSRTNQLQLAALAVRIVTSQWWTASLLSSHVAWPCLRWLYTLFSHLKSGASASCTPASLQALWNHLLLISTRWFKKWPAAFNTMEG